MAKTLEFPALGLFYGVELPQQKRNIVRVYTIRVVIRQF